MNLVQKYNQQEIQENRRVGIVIISILLLLLIIIANN